MSTEIIDMTSKQFNPNTTISYFDARIDGDMQRIGNLVFNKAGNRKDQAAWLRIKKHILFQEDKLKSKV
jgi:hypothetical protein